MSKKRNRIGGNVTMRRHGRRHFRRIARLRKRHGGPERRYPPCQKPEYGGRHRFNPATGTCWGCGYSRKTRRFPAKP